MLDSVAVFKDRCDAFGVSEAEYAQLKEKSWNTFGTLAFASGWQPGHADESGLLRIGAVFCNSGASTPPEDRMPVVRRLVWEAYTLCAADLRARAERREDDKPLKLANPERVQRAKEQQQRLTHLSLQDEFEISHALEDIVVQMAEDNAVSYVKWEDCTKRDQERQGIKCDPVWKPDSSGVMRMTKEEENPKSSLRTDLMLQYTLQRRSLAFDRARLCGYAVMEKWTAKMLAAYVQVPEPGYGKVSLSQLRRADARFFKELEDLTKETGIRVKASSVELPLDAAVAKALSCFEVAMALAPVQVSAGKAGAQETTSAQESQTERKLREQLREANRAKAAADRALAEERKRKREAGGNEDDAKRKGKKLKGRGRGQGSGQTGMRVPKAFEGGVAEDPSGQRICFAFNSAGGCSHKGPKCPKGVHKCMIPGCFSSQHGMHEHHE